MSDRSKDTSDALTEIRTVRSRAQSAIAAIGGPEKQSESRHVDAHMNEDGEYIKGYFEFSRDQDADEMVRLLEEFVEKTTKFARKGPARQPGQVKR